MEGAAELQQDGKAQSAAVMHEWWTAVQMKGTLNCCLKEREFQLEIVTCTCLGTFDGAK